MKPIILNKYTTAAIILFTAAAIFIVSALVSTPEEITTATFVISALVCVILGVFILTFSAGEPVDLQIVGILPAQGSLTFCDLMNHLGIHGNAHFLPSRITGEARVMQLNPVSTYDEKHGSEKGSSREKLPAGIMTTPSCELLIEVLKKRYAMVIPHNEENVSLLLRETIEDVLKFAPSVSSSWSGSTVMITFHDYSYIDGCNAIINKSSLCCPISPCPICSLCGTLIAEGVNKVVRLDRCSIGSSSRDITAEFTLLP
jgi:hypothetical protein